MSTMSGTANLTTVATPGIKLCKNGLHEIDPDDPWRSNTGDRCRECYLARQCRSTKRFTKKLTISGRNAERVREARAAGAKGTDRRAYADNRKHARILCRKYGVKLSFYDNLGWYPPDIREALNGHS